MTRIGKILFAAVFACVFGLAVGCSSSDSGSGGGDGDSLNACCDRNDISDSRCELGDRSDLQKQYDDDCSGNTGCKTLSVEGQCPCQCTVCYDETCLRGLCADCSRDAGSGGG